MIFRSIRFKIISWNIALLTLAFLVCGILAYHSFKFNLYRNMDDLLMSRAVGVTESIDTYWETERQEALNDGVRTGAFSKINNINFVKIAQHWVENRSSDPQLLNMIIQIFDSYGKMIVSSAEVPDWSHSLSLPAETINPKSGRFENITLSLNSDKPIDVRTFTIPIREDNKVAYTVRLMTPMSDVDRQLSWLRMILFGFLPLIIFLIGIAGAFLARVSLHPIDQMTTDINRITSHNLHDRIDVPRSNDEIQRLAETFNSMLIRIDEHLIAQQKFIQDLSHEIKTPLTIIRGSLEVALKKERSAERYEALLKDTLEQVANITRIVESLLILARFENHDVALQVTLINLNELIRTALAEIQPLCDAKGILTEYIENDAVELEGDALQLRSALLNLLDNAVKYTPAGHTITVMVRQASGGAKIEIKDTGIGIDAASLPHIFERFYRAEHAGIKERGFGIGLSLVRSVIIAHEGHIDVTSRLNEGTTFSVSLPLKQT
ncbi:MAG: HAMP domain-containing protein [Candidatus Omnitrophica bacterium]|nr:HAMP domain-containing protein [Candidatus Omnitrophota bacterium]